MAKKDVEKFKRLLYVIESTKTMSKDGQTAYFVDDNGKEFEVHADGRLFVRNPNSNVWKQSEDETSSQKKYKYERVTVRVGKRFEDYPVGRHDLMGWLFKMDEYMSLFNSGISIDAIHLCHINSQPWDNRLDNVQWGTCTENRLQAGIVGALEKAFPGLYTAHDYFYGVDYVTVEGGIRNEWIYEYFGEMPKKARLWTPETLESFVMFLMKRGYWKGVFKNEQLRADC